MSACLLFTDSTTTAIGDVLQPDYENMSETIVPLLSIIAWGSLWSYWRRSRSLLALTSFISWNVLLLRFIVLARSQWVLMRRIIGVVLNQNGCGARLENIICIIIYFKRRLFYLFYLDIQLIGELLKLSSGVRGHNGCRAVALQRVCGWRNRCVHYLDLRIIIVNILMINSLIRWLINSLKLLLYDLGHIDIDDKDLVEEHFDHLSLVLFKVRMNLSDFIVHLVLLPDQLIVVLFALRTKIIL